MKRIALVASLVSCLGAGIVSADDTVESNSRYNFNGRSYKLDTFKNIEPSEFTFETEKSDDLLRYPKSIDLAKYQTAVKDQGSRGSCAYFSATGLMESAIKLTQGDDVNISEEYLISYGKGVRKTYTSGDGSTAYDNLKTFKKGGVVFERDMPYQPSWFAKGLPCEGMDEDSSSTSKSCYSHGVPSYELRKKAVRPYKMKYYQLRYRDIESIVETISSKKQSVVISLPVNHNGWHSDTGLAEYNEELDKECKAEPSKCGGHSILVTGYDLDKKIFTFKNSWGDDWGKEGFGHVSFKTFARWSTSYPTTLRLPYRVKVPANANQIIEPVINNPKVRIDYVNSNVVSRIDADVSYIKNGLIYMSTFISYGEETGEENMMKTPEEYKEEYGSFVKGVFYKFLKNDNVTFNENIPSNMTIPYAIINGNILNDNYSKLRVSAYFYTDTEGWKKIFREFVPFQ